LEKSKILLEILKKENLPSPSPIIIQLLKVASEDDTSIKDLANIIEKDPGLAARLIRMANTAHHARRRNVSTISEAIFVIGFNKLRVMALSISIRDSFPYGRIKGMDYERFWNMSLYRAIIVQEFIRSRTFQVSAGPEEAFIAALILEIGLLMLFQVCPEDLQDSFPGGLSSLDDALRWEEEHIGVNHREVGHMVLRRWHFPEQITELQKYWGRRSWSANAPEMAALLEFARVCTHIFYGTTQDFAFIREASLRLGADAEKVNDILGQTFLRVEEVAIDLLSLQVDSTKDILEVMEKANRALAKINASLEHNLARILDLVSSYDEPDQSCEPTTMDDKKKMTENILDAVAHEIRNPLMAIGGFARRMANIVEGRSDLQKYADIIIQESSRLETLLNEVIAYSQHYQPSLDQYNLVELVNELIDDPRYLCEATHIEIVRNFTQDRVLALIDRKAFKKTIRQLIDTAIRYAGRNEEGKKVSIAVKIGAVKDGIEISIHGSQLAIPEDLRRVFSSVDFSSKTLSRGFGLVIARKIVEAHNGHVAFRDENGSHGFVIFLPGVDG
jgi:HD-like signal output (HDOD) protein/nitrogen-specific signal transduction histidine kinase